ncbi:hypothetical protein [Pseudomonas putida]
MKSYSLPLVLAALLSLGTAGAVSATQINAPLASPSAHAPAANTPAQPANPWPNLLSLGSQQPATLAYDDHYRHDRHWQSRREEARRAQWRREQARREAERRREWERRHHHRWG